MNELQRICPVGRSHIAELIRIGDEAGLSRWSADSYVAEIANPNSIMLRLVSSIDNEILGFVVGRMIIGGQVEAVSEAEIYNIAIVKAHRRHGFGRELLMRFIEISAERGARAVWLEVRESNAAAISFYVRHGFEQVQTRPNFYDNPREAALLMRLDLDCKRVAKTQERGL